jgi:broad specificity phosphatase PhoE
VQGQQDVPLSDTGRDQARRLAAHFRSAGVTFDTVFSSDLSRAHETCQIICPENEIVIDCRLRERGYGVMEGKSLKELRAAAEAAGFNEKTYSKFLPPGAESLEQVRIRIQDFCCNHLIVNAIPSQKVLLVTHGGVIRDFMRFFRDQAKCQLTGLREPLQVTPNTGVSTFRVFYATNSRTGSKTMTRAECLTVHDVSHLDDEAVDESANSNQSAISARDVHSATTSHVTSLSEVAPPLEAL